MQFLGSLTGSKALNTTVCTANYNFPFNPFTPKSD